MPYGYNSSRLDQIVATDNGDPASLVSFSSKERGAYIIASEKRQTRDNNVTATSSGLNSSAE